MLARPLVRTLASAAPVLAVAAALSAACGTDAVGIDACREVESARCRRAAACAEDPSCPVQLMSRTNRSNDGVAACIRHYDVACLHGLVTPRVPSTAEVEACVAAIDGGDCCVVRTPESASACAWLIPPDTPPQDAAAQDGEAPEPDAAE